LTPHGSAKESFQIGSLLAQTLVPVFCSITSQAIMSDESRVIPTKKANIQEKNSIEIDMA
jgi:hypothetical protein